MARKSYQNGHLQRDVHDTKQLWVNTGPDVGQPNDSQQQRTNRRKYSDELHEVLLEYGYGDITEWVIERCPYFQRVAWAIVLLETYTDDYLTESEVVELFGEKFANNLRKGKSDLLKRIAKIFPDEYTAA